MTTPSFAHAMTLRPVSDSPDGPTFAADLNPHWTIGAKIHGGVMVALCARAGSWVAERIAPRRDEAGDDEPLQQGRAPELSLAGGRQEPVLVAGLPPQAPLVLRNDDRRPLVLTLACPAAAAETPWRARSMCADTSALTRAISTSV